MKLKVPSKNYRAAYWFSLPFAYKRKREEVSPSVWEVARSARGAGLAQHITACYKHDVMFCAELTTEQSHHYSARWCAVIRFKSIKVVWGKTRVFPHMRHITSVELSSQTVQWTVWEKALECLTCCWQRKLLYFSDTLRLSPRHTLCSHSHILYW
jgi:hypothetical protein